MVRHALGYGRLFRIHHTVYSLVPLEALRPLAREHAAILACGLGAVLSHHSAAVVWKLRPPPADEIVHVTAVGSDCGRRRSGIRPHRVATLDRRDVRVVEGVPTTAPARTLLDIAPDLTDRELERAFDEAIAIRLMTRGHVIAMLERYPRRPAVGRLRALAQPERKATMTRSEAEECFYKLIRKSGLPEPATNVKVGRYEVDFMWRQQQLIVEIDGFAFHSSRAALERDHRRDAELQAAGYMVIRIGWRELMAQPEAVLVRIAVALTRRSPPG